jgi:5-(carboxyamino)imidazole ribonucleotide synthase
LSIFQIETTNYALIEEKMDIFKNEELLPGVLKTCTLGYDGKGQFVIKNKEEANKLEIDFNKKYILERQIVLKKEISIIVTRFSNNECSIFEPFENLHINQILNKSDENNNLLVNEIAPRVHNSGHLTINAYNISQFENHIRAVCNLEKVELKKFYNAEMINIIGEDIKTYRGKSYSKNEFFYDYLKKEIKKKRKMGHMTTIKS